MREITAVLLVGWDVRVWVVGRIVMIGKLLYDSLSTRISGRETQFGRFNAKPSF
jgi:hypothetical protein